jgi:hypothetical protein
MYDDQDLGGLEDELRRRRPAPRQEFLDGIVSRVEAAAPTRETPLRRTRPRFRLGFAVAFASLFAVAFTAMGALGYAGSSTAGAVKGTFGAVKSVVGTDREPAAKPAAKVDRDAARQDTAQAAAGTGAIAKKLTAAGADPKAAAAGAAFASGALGSSASSPGALSSRFQYPRFVVICVDFGLKRPFTIVIPRFLLPIFQPFILHLGPCTAEDFDNKPPKHR